MSAHLLVALAATAFFWPIHASSNATDKLSSRLSAQDVRAGSMDSTVMRKGSETEEYATEYDTSLMEPEECGKFEIENQCPTGCWWQTDVSPKCQAQARIAAPPSPVFQKFAVSGDCNADVQRTYDVKMSYVFECPNGGLVESPLSDALPVTFSEIDAHGRGNCHSRPIMKPGEKALDGAEVGISQRPWGKLLKYRYYASYHDASEGSWLQDEQPHEDDKFPNPHNSQYTIEERELKTGQMWGTLLPNECEIPKHKHKPLLMDWLRGAWKIAAFSTKHKPPSLTSCQHCTSWNCQKTDKTGWETFCSGAEGEQQCKDKQKDGKDPTRISKQAFVDSVVMVDMILTMADGSNWGGDKIEAAKKFETCSRDTSLKGITETEDAEVRALKEYVEKRRNRIMMSDKDEKERSRSKYAKWINNRFVFAKRVFDLGQLLMNARTSGLDSRQVSAPGLDRQAFVYCWMVANAAQRGTQNKWAWSGIEMYPEKDDWFGSSDPKDKPTYWDAQGPLAKVRSKFNMYRLFANYEHPNEKKYTVETNVKRDYHKVQITKNHFIKFWLSLKAEKMNNDIEGYRTFLEQAFEGAQEYGFSVEQKHFFKAKTKHESLRGVGFQYMSLLADEYPCEKRRLSTKDATATGVWQVGDKKSPDQLELLGEDMYENFPLGGKWDEFPEIE